MKVLMISGDRHILLPGTVVFERLQLQRNWVDELDVLVWPQVHTLWQVIRAIFHTRYDVITSQDPFWRGLLCWLIARLRRARLNIQVHTTLGGESLFRRHLAKFVLRRANTIRVVSEASKKHIESLGALGRVAVLPVFVDIERFKSVVHIPSERKRILWIGRFEEEKDPLFALEVIREIRSRGLDPSFVMLGKGTLESTLKSKAQDLSVAFPGWHDPQQYLAVADVVISTSPYESWGSSIVEALAAGVQVVSFDVGIARDAGATIANRVNFALTVMNVLKDGERGSLKLFLLSAEAWAQAWRESLA